MKTKKSSDINKENVISFYLKLSKKEKEIFRNASNITFLKKKTLTFDDLIQFEKIKESLTPLKNRYNLTINDIFCLIKEQLFLPISIFNKKLTVLESTVKYLKEINQTSLKEISSLLKRDQRNIWQIYNTSKKKYPDELQVKDSDYHIPISIFSGKLSALESLVTYLRESFTLSYHEIALLLERDDRTIWTVYQRARRKYEK